MTNFQIVHNYNDGAKHIRIGRVSMVITKEGLIEWSDNWAWLEDLADQGYISRKQVPGTQGHTDYRLDWSKLSEKLNGEVD